MAGGSSILNDGQQLSTLLFSNCTREECLDKEVLSGNCTSFMPHSELTRKAFLALSVFTLVTTKCSWGKLFPLTYLWKKAIAAIKTNGVMLKIIYKYWTEFLPKIEFSSDRYTISSVSGIQVSVMLSYLWSGQTSHFLVNWPIAYRCGRNCLQMHTLAV